MDTQTKEFSATVVIGTFGERSWRRLAERRAIPSAADQGVPVIHKHRRTLAQARNACLEQVETEFVVHLDADDQIEPGFIDAMAKGTKDVRVPLLRQVRKRLGRGPEPDPFWPRVYGHEHDCVPECLRFGNWIIIGACVRTDIARAHGWEEFGWSEDWAMWARCWKAGATFERIPDAVYRAWRSLGSRNQVSHAEGMRWHMEIEKAIWPQETSVVP